MERQHNKKSSLPIKSTYSHDIKNLQKETQQMEEQLKMLQIVNGTSLSSPSKSASSKTPSKPKQSYVEPTSPIQTHWSHSKTIKYQPPTATTTVTPSQPKIKQTYERVDSVGVGRSVDVKKEDFAGSFNEDESHRSFLEALNEWRRGSGISEKVSEKPKPTNVSVSASETGVGGDLLKGAFDEGESHQSFLEALNAWRGNTTAQSDTKTSKPPTTTPTTVETSTGNDSENDSDKKVEMQLQPSGTSEWGKAISEGAVSIPVNSYFAKLQRAKENAKTDG
eukprot:TRINITY_DN9453_c0_g1_i1.p1 TRINITY_DN9453_c0_g1~~TRINITY_DN9453_c0_g1_i1.p1  ORF type:complete len:279 (+),score=81.93 TRINITY_DN9453_c0_g1_i1:159-995(+)